MMRVQAVRRHPGAARTGKAYFAVIEAAPVAREVLDDVRHARCQPVCHGEGAWQLGAQRVPALADGDATLEQEGADLVDDPRCGGKSVARARGGAPAGRAARVSSAPRIWRWAVSQPRRSPAHH